VSAEDAPALDRTALLAAFVEHDARFVIVGGVAGQVYGATRVTKDLDLCPAWSAENLGSVAAALRDPEHQPIRARTLRTADRRCHYRRGRRPPRCRRVAADIIRSKEIADRPKDRDALEQLRALERLHRHQEAEREPLDLGFEP
jgi:hypothetical protein